MDEDSSPFSLETPIMDSLSDDLDPSVLARIQDGDTDAFAQMVESQSLRIHGFIRRTASEALLTRVEADDLLQEAVTGAIKALPEVAGPELDPMAWLFGLLRRRIIDAHRHHFASQRRAAGKQKSLDAAFSPDGEGGGLADLLIASMTSPSAAFSRDMKVVRVRQAIESLEPEKREILRLKFAERLPTKEIADRIGKTDAAVRVTLSRSLRKLEQILGNP